MTGLPDQFPMITPADEVPGRKQGQWTYKDYTALDDGKRYEIVNGVLFRIPTPYLLHQEVVGNLAYYLLAHTKSAGIGRAFLGPLDIELAPNVVVQPDIVVVLSAGREKIIESHMIGAPDLVIEVSSPGTIGYERREKQDAYARAEVPEYWIVNPEAQTVEVLVSKGGKYYSLGVFHGRATLPSRIMPEFTVHVEQLFVSVWS